MCASNLKDRKKEDVRDFSSMTCAYDNDSSYPVANRALSVLVLSLSSAFERFSGGLS